MGCNAMQPCPLAKSGVAERKGARSGRGITQDAQADVISGAEAWGNPVGGEALPLRGAGGSAP